MQIRTFGEHLDKGGKAIDDTAATIAAKDMEQMRAEATSGGKTLHSLTENKLDASIDQQNDGAKTLREELDGNFQRLGT